MPGYDHELAGGHPALDFINSVHDWTAESPRDYFGDIGDAMAFGIATRLLSPEEARTLSGKATERELAKLRVLRASLERVFRAEVEGRKPAAEDLAALARDAAAASAAVALEHRGGRILRRIPAALGGAATLRHRIVDAALTLLTSPDMARVKACGACGWFFRDDSKNQSRRWCSMMTCGSVVKSRAYYARSRRKRR